MPAVRIPDAEWERRVMAALRTMPGATEFDLRKSGAVAATSAAITKAVARLVEAGRIRREPRKGPGGGNLLYAVADADTPDIAGDVPIEELIRQRQQRFEQVRRAYTHQTVIKLPDDKPIAIWHCGDPHADDDGTDLGALYRDAEIVRTTPGLWGGNVGDTTNNWVGRLARLYGQQTTTARDGWRLAEDFIKRVPWLYLVSGNHDQWSGAGDPLQWIARLCGAPAPQLDARLTLRWRGGSEMRIWVRHSFPGTSQYNAAHGVGKAARTSDADLLVCGHWHQCGDMTVGHDDGTVTKAVQVGSYKAYDRYQRERGFGTAQAFAPCAVTVLDPRRTGAGRVHVCWSAEEGADLLTWARRRK